MAEEQKHHHLFHHKKDEDQPPVQESIYSETTGYGEPGGGYAETTEVMAVGSGPEHDYKKEEKHHKHLEHVGELGATAAGAYGLVYQTLPVFVHLD
ncbi:hypothetical protein CRG98_046183 [Punica granatum]|uniref:Uncharacterized protein n=1 Tax=Punica granatum TaxID=22663 RepID=A0A2I0HPL4_PUNGR|nr:hypothetical protein CRG98_046183 [Punica granatum]